MGCGIAVAAAAAAVSAEEEAQTPQSLRSEKRVEQTREQKSDVEAGCCD
jgi:hypothetical protein